jgi:predicted transcriptional regulator of viral defense system
VINVRHGLWWLEGPIEAHRLAPHLTAPLESYVSLQTALHLRGLIEQVPSVIYAVTLGRTQRIATSVGTYSFHHLAPEVFGGYETTERGAKIATAEKALFDFAYLSAGRLRLFTALPELELPRGFRHAELTRWLAKIPSERSRTVTQRKLAELLDRELASFATQSVRRRRANRS